MSNIAEELHEDEDESNTHKRQSNIQNKTFEEFKFGDSPMNKFKQ